MNTTKNGTWNQAVLSIYWRADRHEESHSIVFKRPTELTPAPEHPVVVGKPLSTYRLDMSSEWGQLFATIVVKAYDEHSLTVKYGKREIVLKPEYGHMKIDEGGMSYTSFELYLGLEDAPERTIQITPDETFLRHFRTKERVMMLSGDDVSVLKHVAAQGNAYAQYGYGRWLYYNNPEKDSMREAEELIIAAKPFIPDALASYALMLRYGDTKENVMDIEESDKLLLSALKKGSIRAAQQRARQRIFGVDCEAEPEQVAKEIEKLLSEESDPDPHWHALLAYAYKELGRIDDAVAQFKRCIELGDVDYYFNLAFIYKDRGNMALYEEMLEEGIDKGSGSCCFFRADMDEEDFKQLSYDEQRDLHYNIAKWLHWGINRGEGLCAYFLWMNHYYGTMGFSRDAHAAAIYLREGVRLAHTDSIEQMAKLAEDGEWPDPLSPTEIAELWLRAARYGSTGWALKALKRTSDPAFLLKHKEELERYWQPQFPEDDDEDEVDEDDGRWDAYS